MTKNKILIIFCFISFAYINGQSIRIDSIRFSGNKRNNAKYLSRFISSDNQNKYDSSKIQEDMRLLRTLPGVLDVQYSIENRPEANILTYSIIERWTLFPTGDFKLTNDEKWIGFGLMNSNLFGRGIYFYYLHTTPTNWGDHIIVRYPYIMGRRIGVDFEFRNKKVDEELEADLISVRTLDYQAAIKYEIKFEHELLFGYSRRAYSMGFSESDPHDYSPRSNGFFVESRNQRMDYHIMQQDGWQNKLKVHYEFLTNGEHGIFSFFDELKVFKSINKINLAGRFSGGFSNEKNHSFQPYFIDNSRTIRGAGYRAARGNRLLSANIECRYSLFQVKYFGLQMVGFLDSAHIEHISGSTSDKQNVAYLGGGTRFIFIKGHNAMISIDYSINLDSPFNKQFILSWGQYF